MTLALEGLKVLDFTHMGPGWYCTMLLGDMGADVLRVERPPQDGAPPEESDNVWGWSRLMNTVYEGLNRNKRSIALNLRSEEAREVVYRLSRDTDIVVEGFRPGVAKRLGIDYQTLREINPRLIYCSMSGYGQDGPYCEMAGHDVNYNSMAGAQDMIGQRNGPHALVPLFIADFAGGTLHAVIGILTAVVAREKIGHGQYVDISYFDGVLSLMTAFAYDYLNYGVEYRRGETPFSGGFPWFNIYETKDGKYFTLGILEPWFWENLCRVLNREDFIPYQFDKAQKREEIAAYFQKVFRTKTRDEWFDFLKDKNIPIGKLYNIGEVFNDPQVLHRQMLVEVDHPTRGKTRQVGIAIKLSDTPGRIRTGAPVPGQHTEQVLAQLGYSRERIAELSQSGAIYLHGDDY